MVGEGRNRVRVKIGQQRHRHAAIDIDSPKGHRPTGAVAGTKGDFIPLADTYSLEKDAEPFNVDSQLCIGKRVAIVVTQGLLGPMLAHSVLEILQIVPHRYLVLVDIHKGTTNHWIITYLSINTLLY